MVPDSLPYKHTQIKFTHNKTRSHNVLIITRIYHRNTNRIFSHPYHNQNFVRSTNGTHGVFCSLQKKYNEYENFIQLETVS